MKFTPRIPLRVVILIATVLVIIGLLMSQTPPLKAQMQPNLEDYRATLIRLVGLVDDARRNVGEGDYALVEAIGDYGDPLYIAPLIDIAYFTQNPADGNTILEALEKLTGEPRQLGWRGFFEWAGRESVALPPDYDIFKGLLYSSIIDAEFARFFASDVLDTAQVNLAEVIWGGVRVDGIPSLVNARQITPEAATLEGKTLTQFCREDDCRYPAPGEFVFGVSIDGDNRAYPLRLLNWHEMFNDVIGHTPLFDEPDGQELCRFRAPTPFQTIARAGEKWVHVQGTSAGCPESGWIHVEAIRWADGDWESVRDALPDTTNDEAPLTGQEGVTGRVQGKPVMLAYCTLCGAGILYDVTIPNLSYVDDAGETVTMGETVLEFGSTGMLMRSNKLMYDRNTDTVWNALTGRPAFGPLASSGIELPLLPIVVTDWESWLEDHPDTSVLSLDTGYSRPYQNGAAYEDYFNDPDFIMFPVWQQDTSQQANKEMIFALTLGDVKKAYPLQVLIPEQVTNDTVNGESVVLVTQATPDRDFFEPGGAAVRAYQRGEQTFAPTGTAGEIRDGDGQLWQVTETALIRPDGEQLERLPGHLAFWFGWFSFNPDTLVYAG